MGVQHYKKTTFAVAIVTILLSIALYERDYVFSDNGVVGNTQKHILEIFEDDLSLVKPKKRGQLSKNNLHSEISSKKVSNRSDWRTTTKQRTPSCELATSSEKEHSLRDVNNHVYGKKGEKHHVVFLKVHKTGSTSVQNIFLRFGDSRNLTFVLPHDNKRKAETTLPNVISLYNSLTKRNIVPPPVCRHYDILCCHVIYSRAEFNKYLPSDTAYIGLVRYPITRLESAIRFFRLYPETNLSDFAANPLLYDRKQQSMTNNRMAFAFNYPLKLFPNFDNKVKPTSLLEEIRNYTNKVIKEFDLIMLTEKLNESLVLMKKLLQWHVKDVIYIEEKLKGHNIRRFKKTDYEKLKSFLYLDYALYEAAAKELDAKIESAGVDFKDEVLRFKQDKYKIQEFCHKSTENQLSLDESKWDSAYKVTRKDCNLYQIGEIRYIQELRKKQYGRIGI